MNDLRERRRELCFDDYPTALKALTEELNGRTYDPTVDYMVLTPDRYTQSVEHALFTGGGALDCEVLTLSRLCRRISHISTLSREGGVMLTTRAVENVKNDLVYYKRAAAFPSFGREAYATLLQIGASDVDIDFAAQTADGITRSKLKDLARIKAEYDALKADNGDAVDRLVTLIKELPTSELVKRAHVYIIGYSLGDIDTTKLNRKVFDSIADVALSFTEFKAIAPQERRKNVRVFSAPDRITQYKQIAATVREYADMREDTAYGDISIICPEPRALMRILTEYGIPAYADESTPLFELPPLTAIYNLYKLKTGGDGQSLVAFCKNPFSDCADEDALVLQSYVTSHGVGHGALDRDYSKAGDGVLRAVERARMLADAFTGSFADAVKNVMDMGAFETVGEKLDTGTDTVTPVYELCELLKTYGSGEFESDAAAFFAAARALEVKSLPRERDRVSVTVPQTLRLSACKFLIVADFNEGVLPAASADDGLLCDSELGMLERSGSVIEPKVALKNKRERIELHAVVNNAEELYFTYSEAGRGKPSAFIGMLTDGIELREYSGASALLELDGVRAVEKDGTIGYAPDPAATFDKLTFYACTDGAAREIAARKACKLYKSVAAAVPESEMIAAEFYGEIGEIAHGALSVSELNDWFTCPYKRFLRYSVALNERRTGALNAPDFGIIVHEFMELFIKDGSYDCSRERVRALIDKALNVKDIEIDENSRERLVDDAVDFATVNTNIIKAGEYTPLLTEHRFDVELQGDDGAPVEFCGVIDRIDACGDVVRIIDYKTGKKSFSEENCINGCDMQLPLYAAAMGCDKRLYGKTVSGVFYVTLAQKYDEDALPMNGRLIKDADILAKYDRELTARAASSDGYVSSELFSVRVKNDGGEIKIHGGSAAPMSSEELSAVIKRCVRNASRAADEIKRGFIERTPVDGGCEHCPFGGICGNSKQIRAEASVENE